MTSASQRSTATLADYGRDFHTQSGEDGIIEEIYRRIGPGTRLCVEFGAWDGCYLSNTAHLIEEGWRGVLIEGDPAKIGDLQRNMARYDCRCIQAMVAPSGPSSLEAILARHGVDTEIDLLSIDIDGDDYYILQGLRHLRPRVIVCEYNPTIPALQELIPPPGNDLGCSARSLVTLARSMGYALVAVTDSNCLFVRAEYAAAFEGLETDLAAIKVDRFLTHLITSYSGGFLASQTPTYGALYAYDRPCRGPQHLLRPRPSWLHRMRLWVYRRTRRLR